MKCKFYIIFVVKMGMPYLDHSLGSMPNKSMIKMDIKLNYLF